MSAACCPAIAGAEEDASGRKESSLPWMRAVIVDDAPTDRELLRTRLARLRSVVVAGEAGSVAEARRLLDRADYDIVFLDVELLGGNAFDLVPLVKPPAHIIFITAHEAHAVRAFEINALDYIVKPFTAERLALALRRAAERRVGSGARTLRSDDHIFLRGAAAGGRFVRLTDVLAILSSENYTEVLLDDGGRWLIRRTMQAWEHLLPKQLFVRVHRTAIVNVRHVERVERRRRCPTRLLIRGVRQPLRVGRGYWTRLRHALEGKTK